MKRRITEYTPGFGSGAVSNDFGAGELRDDKKGSVQKAVANLLSKHRDELLELLGDDIVSALDTVSERVQESRARQFAESLR